MIFLQNPEREILFNIFTLVSELSARRGVATREKYPMNLNWATHTHLILRYQHFLYLVPPRVGTWNAIADNCSRLRAAQNDAPCCLPAPVPFSNPSFAIVSSVRLVDSSQCRLSLMPVPYSRYATLDMSNSDAPISVGPFFILTHYAVYSPPFFGTHAFASFRVCAIVRISIGVSILTRLHGLRLNLTD